MTSTGHLPLAFPFYPPSSLHRPGVSANHNGDTRKALRDLSSPRPHRDEAQSRAMPGVSKTNGESRESGESESESESESEGEKSSEARRESGKQQTGYPSDWQRD